LAIAILAAFAGGASASATTMIDTTGPSSWDSSNNYANGYTCCSSTIGEIITAPASDTLLDSFTLYVRSDPPHPVYTATLRGEVYQSDASGHPVGSGLWESAPQPVSFTRTWTELTFRPANVRLVTGQRYILFISPNRDNPSGQETPSTGWASNSHPNTMQYDPSPRRAWTAFTSTSADWTSSQWYCYGCSSNTDLAFKATLLPGTQPPAVTTGPASGVTSSAATLSGSVNPNGVAVTDCHFEYGLSTSYGASAPCSPPPGAGNDAADVTAAVSGLLPNMLYHYHLVATNSSGLTGDGGDRTFTTASTVGGPPSNAFSLTGKSSSSSGAVTINLNLPGPGTVNAVATASGAQAASAKKRRKPKKLTVANAHASVPQAGPFTITLKASGKAKAVLRRHKLTAKVKITFTPTGGQPATKTLTVTFKQAKAKKK
jgi:hypothetical protein